MKVAVLQSNYIPWKGYFRLINTVDIFSFYDNVQFTKNDWRNRNTIMMNDNLIWQTIPVSKDAVKSNISEVNFIDTDWKRKHIKTFKQAYSKAPFFKVIHDLYCDTLVDFNSDNLSILNQKLIIEICSYIGINTKILNQPFLDSGENKSVRLVKYLNSLGATEYYSGLRGKNYLDEELFLKNKMGLNFISNKAYKKYQRINDYYTDNVSILDLLVHVSQNELQDYI